MGSFDLSNPEGRVWLRPLLVSRPAAKSIVTGRLLPRRFRLDASDDFFVVDEAVEEVVPGFRRTARIGKHLPQLIDAIV
ncbi:hypothetical protein CN173_32835, partial [Sinorhizobium meliloti]